MIVAGEVKGHFEQLLLNSLQGIEEEYDESKFDDDRLKDDIKKLHKMGLGKMGCDEAGIFKMVCAAPPDYLKKLNIGFAEEHGYTLKMALERELKGDTEAAATFIVGIKVDPYDEVAKLVNKACAGFGTNEALLQATLIRYQGIMNQVKLSYIDAYGKTIQDTIKAECGGDYEDILQLIVGE
jgi:Annexin